MDHMEFNTVDVVTLHARRHSFPFHRNIIPTFSAFLKHLDRIFALPFLLSFSALHHNPK